MVDWESFYASFRRPDFIPGYEIQSHLGGGAFGEVYKAEKTSIGKLYAIKFLRLDKEGSSGAVERELDSVRLFASIDHPNLVTIEDMGVVESVPYVIMGFAGTETLARRLEERELNTGSALRYFVQVCRGVLALHDRNLAHFDLKPSNIFLRGNVARVGDYGLSKLLIEERKTLSFGRGTPQYMAPEMLKKRADHRADIYSLGVILFECFTYELPFAEAGGPGVLREEDAPPVFKPEFPRNLVEVVTRCLHLDPEDRYPSLTELLGALGQTARQGDSVRLKVGELSKETRSLQEEEPLTSVGRSQDSTDEPPSSADGLRRAATELVRGAADVARGVWDGVVERVTPGERTETKPEVPPSSSEPRETPAATPPAEGGAGGEVLVFSSLDDAEDPTPEDLEKAAWREELDRSRMVRRGELEPIPVGGRPAAFATVPVPPPAEGGWIGSILQSVVVGVEIMGALLTGPILVGLRSSTEFLNRVLSGVPRPLERLLRTFFMLVLLALLGALVVAVFLISLPANP